MIPQEELAVDEVSDTPTKVLHLIPGENCKSFREHKQTKTFMYNLFSFTFHNSHSLRFTDKYTQP